ncbi:phospholipase-like protein D1 [Periconia macrospinosa]|uniref:Phospholipase D1 n=1 Tax=Periconia macrospinosa TaxID=97972 RepID=A0A2V1DIK0_9PLEO|nr:phospholipase-like protein D1 [Periconia macrospinosa]
MGDSPDSGVSPMNTSTALPQPPPKSDASSRNFSPLRTIRSANSDAADASNGAPVIIKSAPTGEPLSPETLDEFPFHASSSSLRTQPTTPQLNTNNIEPNTKPHHSANGSANGSPAHHPSFAPVSRRPTAEGDESDAAPKGRRSVQFGRSTTFGTDPNPHSRQQSWDIEEEGGKGKDRERQGSSLMTKLKALAAPMTLQGHGRSQSAFTAYSMPEGSPRGPLTPASEREEFRYYDGHDSEADADAEESAGEGPSRPRRKRKRSRRWFDDGNEGPQTAPTTPRHPSFFSRDSPTTTPTSSQPFRPTFLRRGTMSDIPENQRQGVSEDEGRDRLAKESTWARGLHSARGLSYGGLRRHDPNSGEDPGERRPSNLRRLTAFGSNGDNGQPSPWRIRGERTQSLSAQKWKSIKNSLRLLGNRAKAERQVDHAKSAELMAELLAGAPAALFLASMFQRDEHGHKRIPILLEQLKVTITDTDQPEAREDGDRHTALRVELEYGSGLTRMKWVIYRSVRDFANLHLKFKLQDKQNSLLNRPNKGKDAKDKLKVKASEKQSEQDDRTPKLPRFPKSVLPYLRGLRGYGILDDEEEEEEKDDGDDNASGTDRPGRTLRQKSSYHLRRQSSITGAQTGGVVAQSNGRQGSFAGPAGAPLSSKQNHQERQRKKLETYLKELITYLIFRPDSNRLCKFLELSALGVRLAAEGGYHGKEGLMMIKSTKGVDARKKWSPIPLMQRHWPKWFLVRHSYIVCVDSPEEMNVYDVFLVDSDFSIDDDKPQKLSQKKARDIASEAKASATGHHQLRIVNSERTMKLLAKNERQLKQFEDSIRFMMRNSDWTKTNRFQSFAPVRKRIYAQWLVDGRDYMWNVSRAISMAKDVIYIHDWWLSPELYLRRPAAISQKWRLDRLLQRKAQEGVKVFVIMYRNVNAAIPIDSEYSKYSLLDLHPNIFVQRSPNQIRQNTFFWAHHEKICIVDHTIAFCGGVDLCFGRWDTPQHTVTDDKLTGFESDDKPKDAEHCQLWPGKDYSNPRVQDFFDLDKPYEEMYDRSQTPRMPWHDIGMQIVGQPARDLTRHFVQRWNYLLRQRKPSRPTPFLLPPPDFDPADIEALGLDGTCEVQILRSATSWSLGTPNKTEHSIMNAYVQMIATSEHFVYIENQFYISSSQVYGTKIENKISDALVDRIKRAHINQEDWRACIMIPLMPGFENTVDVQDGSSVRLIMSCQYRSICRGETSIFGRLRAAGIEPEDYIQFYALRSWGEIGPNKALVTEQLYIHAKCMIVDDRVAIIGSANINERSMLGSRDSEVAAIVRDTEVLDSYMAGEPYKVGKFPHTLRMRLMREHLGVDTDKIFEEEWESRHSDAESTDFHTDTSGPPSPTFDRVTEQKLTENKHRLEDELIARAEGLHSFNHDTDWAQENNPHIKPNKKPTSDPRVTNNPAHQKDVRGEGPDHMRDFLRERPLTAQGRDSFVNERGHEVLAVDVAPEGASATPKKSASKTRGRSNTTTTRVSSHSAPDGYIGLPPPRLPRMDTRQLGLTHLSQLPALPVSDDTDIGGPPLQRTFSYESSHIIKPLLADMRRPVVTDDCMRDPLSDAFYLDVWHAAAENNTKLFRQVFRCQPDNEVKTWKEYKEYTTFSDRFNQAQGNGKSTTRKQQDSPGKSGPPGNGASVATVEKIASIPNHTMRQVEALGERLTEKMSKDTADESNMGHVEQWAKDQEKQQQQFSQSSLRLSTADTTADEGAAKNTDDAIVSPMNPPVPNQTFTFPPPPPIPSTEPTATDFAHVNGNTNGHANGPNRSRTVTITEPNREGGPTRAQTAGLGSKRRRRATTRASAKQFDASDEAQLLEKEDARKLLDLVQGHVVLWPYDWLEAEEANGGWLYTVDQIAPLEI